MPTLSGLAGVYAVADTCAAETGLATWPLLSAASVTGDSKVASHERSVPAVSNYVISIWMYVQLSQTKTELTRRG